MFTILRTVCLKKSALIATSLSRSHDLFFVFVHDIANEDTVVPSVG
jgi:hypothetical protein